MKKEYAIAPVVSLVMKKRIGNFIEEGESWCKLHVNPQSDVESAKCLMNGAIRVSDEKPLVYRTVEG